MTTVPIGYMAKRPMPRPAGFAPTSITEIASVSDCIAERPEDWINEWKHNDWFVYDTPELARDVARKLGAEDWPLAGYLVLPVRFDPDGEVSLEIERTAQPMPPSFQRLGWDVASRSVTPMFECSPLSCNGMATETEVNDFCLLPSLEAAIAFARRCAREQPEPGSYFVVEVWREIACPPNPKAQCGDSDRRLRARTLGTF